MKRVPFKEVPQSKILNTKWCVDWDSGKRTIETLSTASTYMHSKISFDKGTQTGELSKKKAFPVPQPKQTLPKAQPYQINMYHIMVLIFLTVLLIYSIQQCYILRNKKLNQSQFYQVYVPD